MLWTRARCSVAPTYVGVHGLVFGSCTGQEEEKEKK